MAGIVTVALVLASRRTGVTRYPALRSSDFPHGGRLPGSRATIRPSRWLADCTRWVDSTPRATYVGAAPPAPHPTRDALAPDPRRARDRVTHRARQERGRRRVSTFRAGFAAARSQPGGRIDWRRESAAGGVGGWWSRRLVESAAGGVGGWWSRRRCRWGRSAARPRRSPMRRFVACDATGVANPPVRHPICDSALSHPPCGPERCAPDRRRPPGRAPRLRACPPSSSGRAARGSQTIPRGHPGSRSPVPTVAGAWRPSPASGRGAAPRSAWNRGTGRPVARQAAERARARGRRRSTRRHCWSGGRAPRRSSHPAARPDPARPGGTRRTAPHRGRPARGCPAPRRRCG